MGFQLTADGQVDLQKNTQKQVDLKLQIDRLDMRYLSELLNIEEPLSGWTHGVIDLQGSWPNLSLESQLNMEEFSMSNYYLGNGNILFELIPDSIPPESVSPLEQKLSVDWIKIIINLPLKNSLLNRRKCPSKLKEKLT